MSEFLCVAPDVKLGREVKLSKFINLYGCEIGDETKVGTFVEVQKGAKIGKRCKISGFPIRWYMGDGSIVRMVAFIDEKDLNDVPTRVYKYGTQ
jgi:bifunctional N-acetylglucosamine-1-phosphate-uridyltransferase/glucosamine-1-phosphate-acetyltransferase GlmU-like protein